MNVCRVPYCVRLVKDVYCVPYNERLSMDVCRVPYSVRLALNVYRVEYSVSLAMDLCLVPYVKLDTDVSYAIQCETG
jgi:hypothetical protein